jgi:hypothetical protein
MRCFGWLVRRIIFPTVAAEPSMIEHTQFLDIANDLDSKRFFVSSCEALSGMGIALPKFSVR